MQTSNFDQLRRDLWLMNCISVKHTDVSKLAKGNNQTLTNSSNCPVVDKLPSTESKVLEIEILQLFFPCLKAVVGKENNGSIIPETSRNQKEWGHKIVQDNLTIVDFLYLIF